MVLLFKKEYLLLDYKIYEVYFINYNKKYI